MHYLLKRVSAYPRIPGSPKNVPSRRLMSACAKNNVTNEARSVLSCALPVRVVGVWCAGVSVSEWGLRAEGKGGDSRP